ncbi:hypothetical protein SprV_0100043100 [Sparganum proliferum]
MEYQIWDTVQALASSVVGTLAGQALLLGVGVGNAGATILAATLTWMFRDGAGMIGRIAFAGRLGTSLDSQCKQWRLFADLLNDCALFLDLISAHFHGLFTTIVCVSSVLKSLVGLAGGATRAAVTQHQALQNNMADVAAKDASQETLSNFLALLLNFVLVHIVTGNWLLIWLTFWILTPLHLYSNWRAVRCLQFRTLNKARFHIITQDWLAHMSTAHTEYPIASVQEVNRRERIVSIPFLTQSDVSVHLGCSFNSLSGAAGSQLHSLFAVYQAERYLFFCEGWKQAASPARHLTFRIGLRREVDVADQLKALLHVEIITSLISVCDLHAVCFSNLSVVTASAHMFFYWGGGGGGTGETFQRTRPCALRHSLSFSVGVFKFDRSECFLRKMSFCDWRAFFPRPTKAPPVRTELTESLLFSYFDLGDPMHQASRLREPPVVQPFTWLGYCSEQIGTLSSVACL